MVLVPVVFWSARKSVDYKPIRQAGFLDKGGKHDSGKVQIGGGILRLGPDNRSVIIRVTVESKTDIGIGCAEGVRS